MNDIRNEDLKIKDIPSPDADWGTISRFAPTFNGYEHAGSFEKCADIANKCIHVTLTDLRMCLFFEQRRWRHFGEAPYVEAMQYIRSLIEKIRAKITEVDFQ